MVIALFIRKWLTCGAYDRSVTETHWFQEWFSRKYHSDESDSVLGVNFTLDGRCQWAPSIYGAVLALNFMMSTVCTSPSDSVYKEVHVQYLYQFIILYCLFIVFLPVPYFTFTAFKYAGFLHIFSSLSLKLFKGQDHIYT